MSCDLRIATHSRPEVRHVEELAHERGATVEGDDPLVVQRGKSKFTIEVWGAVGCEVDDLDDELATAVLAPRWLTEISVAYGAPKADVTLARALARGLAEACDGAAFDPQEDTLLWPRGGARRYRPPAPEQRIPLLNVRWTLNSWDAPDLPERWLRIVQRRVPEAAPVRYGDFEPLQERMEPGRQDEFIRFWRQHVEADAVYAAGWVARNIIASGRGLWYDGQSESFADFTPLRGRWLGVPPVPAWLSWFGAPYRDRLGGTGERVGRGIVIRVGERPRAVPELASDFPQLPTELVAPPGREEPAAWLPTL
jgi:hypothetical protein